MTSPVALSRCGTHIPAGMCDGAFRRVHHAGMSLSAVAVTPTASLTVDGERRAQRPWR